MCVSVMRPTHITVTVTVIMVSLVSILISIVPHCACLIVSVTTPIPIAFITTIPNTSGVANSITVHLTVIAHIILIIPYFLFLRGT